MKKEELSVVLDEIEQRANKATRGPWRVDNNSINSAIAIRPGQTGYLLATISRDNMIYREDKSNAGDDSNFIATSRTDVPALVKALRRQLAFIENTAGVLAPSSVELLKKEIITLLTSTKEEP